MHQGYRGFLCLFVALILREIDGFTALEQKLVNFSGRIKQILQPSVPDNRVIVLRNHTSVRL